MAGRWRMATVQMSFAIMPAAIYWFAGYSIAHGDTAISIGTVVAFTTLQTRLLFPMQSLLSVGLEVQTSLALFGRIFEYLDLPVDIVERPDARALERRARRRAARRTCGSATRPMRRGRCARSTPRSRRARARRSSARPARARRRSPISSRACTSPSAAPCSIDGIDIRDMTLASLAATVGLVSQETYLFHASIRENLRFACPDASDEEIEDAARAAQIHELIARCPRAMTRPSASAATASPAARSSASRSRARSCATRRC